MLKAEQFLTILVLIFMGCDASEITCPETSRPHKTECNKYFKCIKLPNNSLSWITLTCQEGLIYDKHLRSCAIPDDNWDCNLSGEEIEDGDTQSDESNVYGVKNFSAEDEDNFYRHENDEFLEVIDGEKDLESFDSEKSRSDNVENSNDDDASGDGNFEEFITPSTPSVGMLTTQVQRLSQLVKNIPKTHSDITSDDLNSYLATQNIQSKSPGYQDFNSGDKKTIPDDGKVHPEIESELINRQNDLNTKMTTLSMDQTTGKPIFYINKEPLTEIKLNTGQSLDGTAAHQIVVNRPEGSVLFNVPAASENANTKQHTPYLTEDILKTLLEISKQMVTQKMSNNQENRQPAHPIYYAVPIPIISPQNNIPNYHSQNFNQNQTVSVTQPPLDVTDVFPSKPQINRIKNKNGNNRINYYHSSNKKPYDQNNGISQGIPENFNKYSPYDDPQHFNNQQSVPGNVKTQENYQNYNQQQYQYPAQYFSPYNPNYPQNYQYYNPLSYYQYSKNDRFNTQSDFSNYNGAYYGNRPFVSDSSAPYLDHSYALQQNPYRKESFSPSTYENDDYAFHEESDEKFDDNSNDETDTSEEEKPPKGPTDGLICTFALSRQANQTDCFKYYVCNAKTNEVLTYTCPSFTAFNDQTKFCDSGLYKSCKKSQDQTLGNLKDKKIYAEAHKALEQAKRESQKVERIANLVKKQSQRIIGNRNQIEYVEEDDEPQPSFYQPSAQSVRTPIPQRPQRPKQTYKTRPKITRKTSSYASKSNNKRKKKKVKCTSIGNISDPEDSYSYWHCFKSSDGRLKRIHKKCSSNLKFCSQTKFCSPRC